ncbi:hypothetical protein L3Q82_015548 [Scortum barcoo]|uniref:Uncharacterized protein n=1 Tax=Scortum barcoo TaxID=214431 RepID=A0ACB8VN82_9TELE|nr:hypothetical protein L3Q82_015548 [Scortum barcoo]
MCRSHLSLLKTSPEQPGGEVETWQVAVMMAWWIAQPVEPQAWEGQARPVRRSLLNLSAVPGVRDKECSLYVIIDALMLVNTRLTAEKTLSAEEGPPETVRFGKCITGETRADRKARPPIIEWLCVIAAHPMARRRAKYKSCSPPDLESLNSVDGEVRCPLLLLNSASCCPHAVTHKGAMDVNSTLAELDLSGLGALTQRLFGNNSAFPFDNSTTAPTAEEEDLEVNTDVYSRVIVTVIYVALFAVGSLGNSITLYTLLTKKTLQNLQSTVHYHLASLAVSDLLILVLSMPIELYNFIWFHHPWVFGDAVCRGYYFLRDSCSYATALNIASLSVERYMAICHPFKAKSIMSRSRTKKLISAMWLASFALATPMLFIMGQVMRKGEKICTAIVSPVTIKTVLQVGVGQAARSALRAHVSLVCLYAQGGSKVGVLLWLQSPQRQVAHELGVYLLSFCSLHVYMSTKALDKLRLLRTNVSPKLPFVRTDIC